MRKIAEYALIFFGTAVLAAVIIFSVPWFAASDDVGIHTIRAASYVWPIDVPFPVMTVFERVGTGFYQLYYLLHVPFFCIASLLMRGGIVASQLPPMEVVVRGAQLFHVCLIGALFTTMFWATKRMYGRTAAYLSLVLLLAASPTFFGRLFILRPHTLASLLFLIFVMGVIWRKYGLVFAAGAITVLSYTVAFMLIIPAAVVSWMEKNALVLAVALAGLITGVLIHPFGFEYIQYAWLMHIASIGLAAFGMHPGAPGEFSTSSMLLMRGVWPLLIFAAIVIGLCHPKRMRSFLKNRQSLELLVVTACFIPLMFLSSRGGEYFIPLYCVLFAGLIVHIFGSSAGAHESEGNEKEIRLLGKALACVTFIFFIQSYAAAYQFTALSLDPGPTFAAARCVGEGRIYSRDFGDYAHLTFGNQQLHFLTGIDPIFTSLDPVYATYSKPLFAANKSLDDILVTLREMNTKYIMTDEGGLGWEDGLATLLNDDRLLPVCLTPGSNYIFFKILPGNDAMH